MRLFRARSPRSGVSLFVRSYLFNRAPRAEVWVEKQSFENSNVETIGKEELSAASRIAIFHVRVVGAKSEG